MSEISIAFAAPPVIELDLVAPAPEVSVTPVAGPTVTIELPGVASPDGSDLNYEHVQGVASSTWIINHSLDKRPSVTILSSSGDEVEGDITYNSANQITLNFSAAFSGTAYLN